MPQFTKITQKGYKQSLKDNKLKIECPAETPIYAITDSVVILSHIDKNGVGHVNLQGNDGRIYMYAGLAKIYVETGERIESAHRIGISAENLSFSIIKNNKDIDPSEFLKSLDY